MDELLRPLRHASRELRRNWRQLTWWRERIDDRINTPVQQIVRRRSSALNVLDERWDTLIVLDACRADLFRRRVDTTRFDETSIVRSPASETREWLMHTFDGEHGDVVYVAGNPMVSNVMPGSFHSLVEAWREGWDSSTGLICPEAVTASAIDAHESFPNKRLVVHYMQPHAPFVDHPELNYSTNFDDLGLEIVDDHPHNHEDTKCANVWDALEKGLVERGDVWDGYGQTLDRVMDEVETLLETFDDRIVVTSDHGNALGERAWPVPIRTYGHPGNKRLSELIQVPWVVREGERRDIKRGDVDSDTEVSHEHVEKRLAHLGYAEK